MTTGPNRTGSSLTGRKNSYNFIIQYFILQHVVRMGMSGGITRSTLCMGAFDRQNN